MKKTIIHYETDCEYYIALYIISQLLSEYNESTMKEGESRYVDDYNGYRIQMYHNKTSITFYVRKLNEED